MVAHLGSVTAFVSATALAATMGMNAYGGMLTTLTGIDAFRKISPTRSWRGRDHHRARPDLVRGR